MTKLGETGTYPRGSLGPHDEGALNMGVAHDSQGRVHITFGKEVAWLAMEQAEAIELAKAILRHAGARKIEVTL